jgi:hypothetical protein
MSRGILRLVATGLLCLCAPGCIISSDTSSDCQAPTVGQALRGLKPRGKKGRWRRRSMTLRAIGC